MKARGRSVWRFLWRHWPLTGFVLLSTILIMIPHLLERYFIYYPKPLVEDDPSTLGLEYDDVFVVTEDNVRLHGWFVPRAGATTTLLALHGNAGNVGHRVPWIGMLHEAGAHVWLIDYRGYGRSEGKPFEEGLYRDARAAHAWWAGERGAGGEKLVVLGKSLGGCVAVDLAAQVPVDGLILQSTFTNAWDMAKTMLPIGLLQPLIGVHFDSAAKVRAISCPKLFIHGNRDEIVPFRLGRKLFDLAPEPKEFYEVEGAGHNDVPWVAAREYVRRIRRFLESL